MTHYTVKESDNPKRPGWVVITGEVANPPFKPIQYIVNDMVLPTKKMRLSGTPPTRRFALATSLVVKK